MLLQGLLPKPKRTAGYKLQVPATFFSYNWSFCHISAACVAFKQEFNPTCCFLFSSSVPFLTSISPTSITQALLPIVIRKLNLIYYTSCLLSFFQIPAFTQEAPNDFLSTFLSLLQLHKLQLWLVRRRGNRKRHPWIKMEGPDCVLLSHNAEVYCWDLLIHLHCIPWELQSGGKWFCSLPDIALSIARAAKPTEALSSNWDI